MGKLKRFLPAAVAGTVVSSDSEDMLESHRTLLGVLFCDIREAARLCDHAEDREILLSTRAAVAVEDAHAAMPVGEMSFKGMREPVEVFRLAPT